MEAKTPAESIVEMTELILPQHTNGLGTVFGGVVMSWMDIAAAICAQRHSNQTVVTASVDALHFLAPIRLGWIVNIKASVNFASSRSCEVGVRIIAENPTTRQMHHTASAYVTMVAVGPDGKPTPLPPIRPVTADDKRRYEAAIARRQVRLQLKESFTKKKPSRN